ncbi:MAG: zinc ribbon domain-containing protein [Chloroflexi bacterium]|nr:zinc ribbon domain-containing protein [Chloroflexota bacterium]
MPIYEYKCPKCEFKFELRRPMNEANEDAPCPRCQNKAERTFSTFSSYIQGFEYPSSWRKT